MVINFRFGFKMCAHIKLIAFFFLTLQSYFSIFAQSINSYKDTLIGRKHLKIIVYYKNTTAKEVCQFRRTTIHDYFDQYKIMPDSLFDLTIKQGVFFKLNKKGKVVKQKYYSNNERKNKRILGIKFGMWYGDCWSVHYFLGLPLMTTQCQPVWF